MAKVRDFRRMTADAPAAVTTATYADTIGGEELALFRDLQKDAMTAPTMIAFNHYSQKIAERYKIGPQDKLDVTTGVITRAKAGTDG